ncbi:hypothetical protein Tco_0663076 [Tanacetum coccineum]
MDSLQLIDLSKEDDCLLPLSLRDVCEMDSLQLIDLSKEDDCLLPLSLRDSVEDVKLSCAVGFDNASMIKRGKMRPVEERSLSELRKSLDWNSAFFTSQGYKSRDDFVESRVSSPETTFVESKEKIVTKLVCEMDSLQLIDLSKEDDCLLPLSLRDVCEMDSLQLIDLSKEDDCLLPLSLRDVCEMDSLQLIDLSKEDDCLLPLSLRDVCEMDSLQLIDLSKEDDCLLPLSLRDSVEDVKLSCAVGFDNASMIKCGKMRPMEERSLSELRKSLDWNSAFFTSQGLLNPEELSMINKAFQKTSCSCQPSFSSRKDLKPDIHKRSTVPINCHGLAPNQVVMEHKTRKAGAGSTLSSRSQGDFSSRLTSFTTLKTKMSKVHRSNESPSGASSKCISRNIKSRNIKPTIVDRSSVLSPLSSTCSSSTSPSRSFHNATSPSDFHNATSKVHCSNESHSGASSKCISRNIKSRNIKPTIVDRSSSVLSPLSSTCSSSTSPSRSFHNATSPSDFQTPRCDAARPPIRKIKCLGLRMPYPNTGPFDEMRINGRKMWGYISGAKTKPSIGLDRYAEVKSQGSCAKRGQPFLETSRPSFLRRSLDWDSAFITGAGLLTNEEMTLINKGFAEANSNQPSYGTLNDGRPHQVSGQNQTLSDSDGFHLETLESDLPKYVNPDIHIKNKAKKGLKDDIATDHSKATIDKEKRQDGCKNQEESRRLTLRKSLDWDSAFIPSAGLLSFEELSLINRGFKTADPIQSISGASKHIQTHIGSHQDQTSSKSGDLPLGALEILGQTGFENKKEPTSNQKQKSSIRRGKNPESKERKHLISEVDKNRHQIDPRIDSELAKKPQILAVRQIPNLQNPSFSQNNQGNLARRSEHTRKKQEG